MRISLLILAAVLLVLFVYLLPAMTAKLAGSHSWEVIR